MANIAITETGGLFTITLDTWEWTGLTVNGNVIPATSSIPGVQFQYVQTTAGAVRFIATANQNIVIVNPGTIVDLSDPAAPNSTYTCMISYSAVSNVVTLNGALMTASGGFGSSGPLTFSQGRMTGTFAVGS